MITVSDKAKQFLILLLKLCIVGGAFYFIYDRLAHDNQLNWSQFNKLLIEKASIGNVCFILFLSFLNRYLEILKWKNLVNFIKPITIWESTKQVMGALTLALFTPNGIGEYAGKALFFEKEKSKKIVFLNLICNGIQMILTVIFGTFGLLYFNASFNIITPKSVILIFGLFIVLLSLSFFMKRINIKGYSLEKLIHKINVIPKKIHQKNILLAVARYLTFSHQYYVLFLILDVQLPYLSLMAAITSVYFLASALPSFQFLDFAVKGSVAVYFFGLLGVNEWIVVFVTTLMWFLNTVLPVVIGAYFVFTFKSGWKQESLS
ncbi:lysylphosphatidylglycerol synthase domain-containing protein [Flavobacterium terrae]|uniref:Lysylphosphatidylglycerol synthase TM region n=1 Tax=Flavobacterium terrae TaxID=415425 RepID=A0A1M6ABB1_9FLAO|nr:lysylphosphatidylglycerol synthase domain-containing protein [Flavobacterium terrae]SHI33729.1 Lysylphosphatidylglycerol synthase TM region [Flavobacterium terrae]